MSRHAFAAVLAAACILTPVPVYSQTAQAERVTLQQWSQRVGQELDRRLLYPTLIGGQPFATGMVRVKFNCSQNGRPDKVTLLKSSGSNALDRAALSAVNHVATLHPLPDGMKHDQQYQAVLLFETDPDRYAATVKTIRSEALKSNGWFKGPSMAATQAGPILIGAAR